MIVDVQRFQEMLGHVFADASLLEQALTHRSASGCNNERLEFLGDGALNFVIAAEVFRRRGGATEGELSRLRATLVNRASLAELARGLGVGEHIRLGGGEMKSGGHRRDSILADTLEALLGAVYLDGGFEAVRAVVLGLYAQRLDNLPGAGRLKDPKTRLQEHLQSVRLPLPEYRVVATEGRAHARTFRVECRVDGLATMTEGTAGNRRKAEQAAAAAMLAKLSQQQ